MRLALLAKIAVTLGLLGYLAIRIEFAELVAQVSECDPLILTLGTLVLGLQPWIGALRWHVILRSLGVPLSYLPVLRWTYISVLFGQVLPATIGGDALRMWLAQRAGNSLKSAINSVGLDRMVMVLSLVLLIAVSAPLLGSMIANRNFGLLISAVLACGMMGMGALLLMHELPAHLTRFSVFRAITHLARDARRLLLNARYATATLALALISYLNLVFSVYLFALAFGATAELSSFLVLVPPVLVAATLPISIGGWGTREFAMVSALGFAAISADTAMLTSVWLGAGSILIALPGAYLYMVDRSRLKSVAAAQHEQAQTES